MRKKSLKFCCGIICLFLFIGCVTQKKNGKLGKNIPLGDRYADEMKAKTYINHSLNLTLEFDDDWAIKNQYRHFDNFEKMFADLYNSDITEVLFLGYNNKIECGVRAFVAELGVKNQEYFEKLKNQEDSSLSKYKIEYLTTEELLLRNTECYHVVMQLTLNKNNIFIYDSIFFKDSLYNFRVDLWCTKETYEVEKENFLRFFNTVNFDTKKRIETPVSQEKETEGDQTTDITS